MHRSVCLALALSFAAPLAWAQGDKASAPNGAPLQTMQQARNYALTNQSDEPIVSAHARMANGDERDLIWNGPLNPRQGRNIAVPSADCLQRLTVKFQSGRTMETGSADCKLTRILVTNDALQVTGSASDRPPVQ